jgi:hypothetical protein
MVEAVRAALGSECSLLIALVVSVSFTVLGLALRFRCCLPLVCGLAGKDGLSFLEVGSLAGLAYSIPGPPAAAARSPHLARLHFRCAASYFARLLSKVDSLGRRSLAEAIFKQCRIELFVRNARWRWPRVLEFSSLFSFGPRDCSAFPYAARFARTGCALVLSLGSSALGTCFQCPKSPNELHLSSNWALTDDPTTE